MPLKTNIPEAVKGSNHPGLIFTQAKQQIAQAETIDSLSAMAENPPKLQQSTKPVPKVDTKSKADSKGSSSHAPINGQQLSPDVGTAVDVIHGILGR